MTSSSSDAPNYTFPYEKKIRVKKLTRASEFPLSLFFLLFVKQKNLYRVNIHLCLPGDVLGNR